MNALDGMPDLSMFPSVIDVIAGGATGFVNIQAVSAQMESVNATVSQLAGGVVVRLADKDHLTVSLAETRGGLGGTSSIEVSFQRGGRGEGWVLRQLDANSVLAAGGKKATMRSRLHVRGVRVARNLDADRIRSAKKAKRIDSMRDATSKSLSAPAARQTASANHPPLGSTTGIITWNPPMVLPFPLRPPTLTAPGLLAAFDQTEEEATNCEGIPFAASQAVPYQSGAPHVVYQHGFNSSACTWKYPLPALAQFSPGGRIVGQTSSWSPYEAQAAALRAQIPAGTDQWVLVGHSNGGIISRYLAQTEAPGFAKAVITINSPHQGAPIFSGRIGQFLSKLAWVHTAAGVIFARRSAGVNSAAILMSPRSVLQAIRNNGGSLVDQISIGSTFQANLSARNENSFRRFAVRSQIFSEWAGVRVYCDAKVSTAPGVPRGRRCVADTKKEVSRRRWSAGIFGVLSIVAALTPGLFYSAATDAAFVSINYAIDAAYREIFTDWQPSDGVVTMSSQRWSGGGANEERTIYNADSHVGSTKSVMVKDQLADLLRNANQ